MTELGRGLLLVASVWTLEKVREQEMFYRRATTIVA